MQGNCKMSKPAQNTDATLLRRRLHEGGGRRGERGGERGGAEGVNPNIFRVFKVKKSSFLIQ